jgi:hypothetical protein
MSPSKKSRGLQHRPLSEVFDKQVEQSNRLLSRFKEEREFEQIKDQIEDRRIDTRAIQSPVTRTTVDQQSPVSKSQRITGDQESPVTIGHSITNEMDTSDQQTPAANSPQYTGVQPSPVPESHQQTNDRQTPYSDPASAFTKVPNIFFDKLLSILDPYEFKVYARLFRLSHGFRRTQCLVGYKSLADACGLSTRHVKRVIPVLELKGLIKVLKVHNSADTKGTLYEVYTGDQQSRVPDSHERQRVTSAERSSNKEDHEDPLKTDHHQRTKTLYEEVTGNTWSKADQQAYQQIGFIPLGQIESTIRAVFERAKDRPRSLNYFVQEILGAAKAKPIGAAAMRQLEQIVARVRELHVGGDAEGLRQHVERECRRQGIGFDLDLFNEIISR